MAKSKSDKTADSSLSDDQIKAEEKFMKGLPRFNVGAFLMPPIWGPAHGFWITILYYPAWLVADNLFYSTVQEPTVLSVVLSIATFLVLLAITIAFAIVSQPIAAHRAESKGVSRATYLKRQKWWILISAIIAVIFLGLATYYNLVIRPTL